MHHGIKDMKWGQRRFQNPDGTLTEAGKKCYYKSVSNVENSSEKSRKNVRDIYANQSIALHPKSGFSSKYKTINDIYKADLSNTKEKKKIAKNLSKIKKLDEESFNELLRRNSDVLRIQYVGEQKLRDLRKIRKDKYQKLSEDGKYFVNNTMYSPTVLKKLSTKRVKSVNRKKIATLLATAGISSGIYDYNQLSPLLSGGGTSAASAALKTTIRANSGVLIPAATGAAVGYGLYTKASKNK